MKARPRLPVALLLLAPAAAFFGFVFLVPLAHSFLISFGLGADFPSIDSYKRIFGQAFYVRVLWRTVRISAIVVLLSAIIAYPVAYRLLQFSAAPRRYLYILLLAPLLVSHVVVSFGWLVILSPNGLIDQALTALGLIDEPLRLLFTETAIVIGLIQIFLPYMIVSIAASLGNIDPMLLRAAANLGAGPWSVFRRVLLPLSMPGLVAGATIVFSLSMSAFATPAFLGGTRVRVLSSLAWTQAVQVLDWRFAAALSFVLVAVTGIVLMLSSRLAERGRAGMVLH